MVTKGYLLDFNDFRSTLDGVCQDPKGYSDLENAYLEYNWQISRENNEKISVSIGGVQQQSLEKAYEQFKANPDLHESIYRRAMSIWR
jgi:hypothetical protein